MKIGIDARFLTHPQAGGFKTYSENLIAALAEVDGENEYILYLDRLPDRSTKLPNQPNFYNRVVSGLVPVVGMPWREQVSLVRQVGRDRPDLLHSLCLTAPLHLSCPSVVTIHDMIWHLPKEYGGGGSRSIQRKLMDWYFRIIPEYATQRAAAVVTVSEAAKRSIMQYLGLAEMGVFVTYEAASCIYKRMNDVQEIGAMRQKFGLSYEFILAIGSADPRKNIGTLIQAYGLLPVALREQYKLVIVWTHHFLASELANLVRKLDLAADVQFLMHAHNEDLVLLYNAATLFVFPSRYEGFGLPILEAMACGAPVVASNNSSIPEIAGDAAVLVKGQEPEDWASIMTQMLESQALRLDLTNRGFRHAGTFSWTRCAQETLEVYETVVDQS